MDRRKHTLGDQPPLEAVSRSLLLTIYDHLYAAFGPQHWWPGDSPFEIIIGAILTQNTAWTNVEKAIRMLKEKSAFTPKALYRMPHEKLAILIRSSGFFNVKAVRLKTWLTFFFTEYQGKMEQMFSEPGPILRRKLLALRGLGPETVDSILLYAGQKPYFVVDAYTRRIFTRHHFIDENSTYDDIQHFFMTQLPQDVALYNEYHALIVQTAKRYCKTIPDCEHCPLQYLFQKEESTCLSRTAPKD